MKAVRFDDGRVEVTDVQRPPASSGMVRVNVRAAGICGSDLSILRSGFPIQGTPGHEVSGILEDGTPVAIEPVAPCNECRYCYEGNYQVCKAGTGMIYGVGRDGGMAEEIVVPERSLVRLPRGIDVANAFLVEPLAVAIHGLRRARVTPDTSVVVIGGGTIGLCAVAAAAGIGCEVSLVARHDAQVHAGLRMGAQSNRDAYDVAIDCAGTASASQEACERVRPNGRVLFLAASFDEVRFPGLVLAEKEIEIVCSSMYGISSVGRDIDAAAALLGANPEIADVLVTHRFPLDNAPEAFAAAEQRASGALKVVLEP
jgi:threonine dehydrogenase-like Zn-dependent dehydrogenase